MVFWVRNSAGFAVLLEGAEKQCQSLTRLEADVAERVTALRYDRIFAGPSECAPAKPRVLSVLRFV